MKNEKLINMDNSSIVANIFGMFEIFSMNSWNSYVINLLFKNVIISLIHWHNMGQGYKDRMTFVCSKNKFKCPFEIWLQFWKLNI